MGVILNKEMPSLRNVFITPICFYQLIRNKQSFRIPSTLYVFWEYITKLSHRVQGSDIRVQLRHANQKLSISDGL